MESNTAHLSLAPAGTSGHALFVEKGVARWVFEKTGVKLQKIALKKVQQGKEKTVA